MTDATEPEPALTILHDPAAACDGDVCAVPEHPERAIVLRRLDADLV